MKRFFSERSLGLGAVLAAAVLWGTTGTAATFAPQVGAIAIGAVAMGVGGLLQAAFAAKGIAKSGKRLLQLRRYWLLGAAAVAIYPLAFYASMRLAGVTIGTVISIGSAPLFSALIEYCVDSLRLSARWAFGAALGLIGMTLLCLIDGGASSASAHSVEVVYGVALGLLAGFTYAAYSWTARRMMRSGLASRVAMGATFGLGGLFLMPVLYVTGVPLLASWNNAAVGIYMAVIPMFLGYRCFGYGLARVPASTATTITLFEPVVATALAVLIVGERLPLSGWIGIALVIACLICITWPEKRAREDRQAAKDKESGVPAVPE